MRRYSWAEIARHNNTDDCWIVIDGNVYDVTDWVSSHPGGDAVAAMAGEDVSCLFHSSHLRDFGSHLTAYRVGAVEDYTPIFPSINDVFLKTLKARVHRFLKDNRLDHRNTTRNQRSILLTSAFLAACWLFTYLLPPWGILGAILMGLATCSLIGSFGHEQIHGNLKSGTSRRAILSDGIRWGIYIPFMPKIYFQYEHLKHHSYPMHPDHDYDVYALKGLVRLSRLSERGRRHGIQHIYAPLVYGNYILLQLLAGYTTPFFDARELLREKTALPHIIISSLVALIVHIALPIYIAGFWWGLLCISLYFFTWQSAIYITSGLPHMTAHPSHDTSASSWAQHVCSTTANLKCGHWFFDWLTGGLNYHLTHHLLPSVPRDHLPAVNLIVEQTCREFFYPFRTYTRFSKYYRDHYQLLRELGSSAP